MKKQYLLALVFWMCLGWSWHNAPAQTYWQAVGGGASGPVRCLYADTVAGLLYVGGDFGTVGGKNTYQVATWDGANWDSLGPGTGDIGCATGCNGIRSLVPYQGSVFAGGSHYMMAGNVGQGYLNRWDGTHWDTCGSPNGPVILDFSKGKGGDLYALWGFTEISGSAASNMARWDGQKWIPFEGGMPPAVYPGYSVCVEEYQGNLYMGGNFEGNGFGEIGRWDGTQWQPLNVGIRGDSWVNTMTEYKNLLFVGGYFFQNSGNAASCIMAWDGAQWHDPFPEVVFDGQVTDLQVIGGYLYIVGAFRVFEGGSWHGYYSVARYDGQEFCAFGGTNYFADRIAGMGGQLYLATEQEINGVAVNYIARWRGGDSVDVCISQPVGRGEAVELDAARISVYPNPASDAFSIAFGDGTMHSGKVSVLDIAGRVVVPEQTWRTGDSPVDVSMLPAGVYLVQVHVRDRVEYIKLIKN